MPLLGRQRDDLVAVGPCPGGRREQHHLVLAREPARPPLDVDRVPVADEADPHAATLRAYANMIPPAPSRRSADITT